MAAGGAPGSKVPTRETLMIVVRFRGNRPVTVFVAGIDCDASRSREERQMLEDAQSWLNSRQVTDVPHPKTGATALHVAAAKGYIKVIR